MKQYFNRTLIGYSIIHGIIDLCCVYFLFLSIHFTSLGYDSALMVFALYGLIAFGLQFPLGILVDRFQAPKASAFCGTAIVIFSSFNLNEPFLVAVLAGLGNAFFHVGGGSISLNFAPKKAFPPGIFVAPGAIGLMIGTLIGKGGSYDQILPVIFLLFCAGIFILLNKIPHIDYCKRTVKKNVNFLYIATIFILLSIAIRALYGLTATFDWKENIVLLVLLTCAVAGGKAFGGLFADKFGWLKTSIFALVASAPLLAFFQDMPFLAIFGAFLFQMTMPITLSVLSNIFPGRSATVFGMAATMLIIGAIPTFFGFKKLFINEWITFLIIVLSATFLLFGFKILYNTLKKDLGINL